MPKRSLSTFVDSDSESSYGAEVVDSYSDDASKKKISSSKPRRKKKFQKVHASSSSVTHEPEINIGTPPHSKSSHIIKSSGPIRLALLEWYKAVHDIRGMPWRKSYDPTQGPDERAQRAYEVEIFYWIHEGVVIIYNLKGLDFWDYVATNSSCDRDSILHPMDGEVRNCYFDLKLFNLIFFSGFQPFNIL